MSDFVNLLFSCKALASIMAQPKNFKTNAEKYNAAVIALEKKEDVFYRNKGKNLTEDEKRASAIKKLAQAVDELEPIKDELTLPQGCKTFLIKKYITEKYNRIQEVDDFSMLKGIKEENQSIALFNEVNGTNYIKNKQRISDKHLTGIPDLFDGESILNANEVIDIKTPFDIFSFLQSVENPLSNANYWQIQGYMALTNAPVGTISFCLTNTPEWMLEDEIRKLKAKLMGHPQYEQLFRVGRMRIKRNLNYNDIPSKEKVFSVSVDRDEEAIERIYEKIYLCRKFLLEFERKHALFTVRHRKSFLLSEEDD